MSSVSAEEQLQRLRQKVADVLRVGAATGPTEGPSPVPSSMALSREGELGQRRAAARAAPSSSLAAGPQKFLPLAPASLAEAGLAEADVEALVLKLLQKSRTATGSEISAQLALPYHVIEKLLSKMKEHRLLVYKSSTTLHDYVYELTEHGSARAQDCAEQCTYYGAAPVNLADYNAAVAAQSIHRLKVRPADVRKAFGDLTLGDAMLHRVGRAVCSGQGLFLYGSPGNGKSCIAERITKAYGLSIWIPRTLNAYGEIIRLYDPSKHVALPLAQSEGMIGAEQIDQRWIRIQRPTIVVGGEMTMDSLEIHFEGQTGIGEAPLQLKSNCGTLVIDDFGRQRISPAELLNRWIVPLEKHYDFLALASGRKIQVPFDQFVIFSTNLEPRDLVDEAFLRRIPYKIDVSDPTEDQLRQLFVSQATAARMTFAAAEIDYIFASCYQQTGRKMRFCHARDLIHQVEIYCEYLGEAPHLSRAAIDAAASNYFSMV
ncbi:MAG TPA: AAA family ATPase [Pirellulales bacterium]|jgi:predicted ATPase with chaperone activity|nr:AAA family ATPase [Pirellulales bacterium]